MGEVAEMMLDGTLCSSCGAYVGEMGGVPVTCRDCRDPTPRPTPAKASCPRCSRRVKAIGLPQHMRDAHGAVAR